MRKLKLIIVNLVCGTIIPGFIRNKILKCLGHKISCLYPKCTFGFGDGHLIMGEGSYCNVGCFFDLGSDVYIGDEVAIGPNVHFITTTHDFGHENRRAGSVKNNSIYVGTGSWIGADSIILPGVKIGKGVIVGAGSLVTKDLPENGMYMGRPARFIKHL